MRILALVLADLMNESTVGANSVGPACRNTYEVLGTAPLDSVQTMFAKHFDAPLNHVDYRDNGLCYQKYLKDCINASL